MAHSLISLNALAAPSSAGFNVQSHGQKERNGCLTCRERKKRCDKEYPVCSSCRRLNFACRRPDPQYVRKPGRPKWKTGDPATTHATCLCLPSLAPSNLMIERENSLSDTTSQRRIAMRYYVQSFASILSTNKENNSFLSVFLPMAMESPMLLDTILAWSSTHLAFQNESYQSLALETKGSALKSLAQSISTPRELVEIELACSLVHCAMESVSGDTKQWFNHLVGAYNIIQSARRMEGSKANFSSFSTYERRWLLSNFAYHDVLAAVPEDRRPLLVSGHYWEMGDQLPDTYFGIGSRLLYLISEICVLNVDMIESSDPRDWRDFSQRAHKLELELTSWSPDTSATGGSLVELAEMYRSAGLIHLYRVIRRQQSSLAIATAAKIMPQAQNIMDRLQNISRGCLIECSLLFPMFLAGGEIYDTTHMEIIRARMLDILEARHFNNVRPVLTVLEELWSQRLSGKDVDWREIIVRRKWMLSLS